MLIFQVDCNWPNFAYWIYYSYQYIMSEFTSAFRPFFRELLGYRFCRRGRNQHSLCQLAG